MITALAKNNDPLTSDQAAAAISDKDRIIEAITALLRERPSADHELIGAYFALRVANGWPEVPPHSIARRRSEMHTQMGLVVKSDMLPRLTQYGRPATVWQVKEGL